MKLGWLGKRRPAAKRIAQRDAQRDAPYVLPPDPYVTRPFDHLCACGNLLTIVDRWGRCRQCTIGSARHE